MDGRTNSSTVVGTRRNLLNYMRSGGNGDGHVDPGDDRVSELAARIEKLEKLDTAPAPSPPVVRPAETPGPGTLSVGDRVEAVREGLFAPPSTAW